MSTSPVYGWQGQLGIDTVSSVTHRLNFISSTLGLDEEMVDTNGNLGTVDPSVERIRAGIRRPDGQLSLQPTAAELALLLPWITGNTGTGSPAVAYAVSDTLLSRFVVVDKVAKVATYNGCCVSRAGFRGSQGRPLDLSLDICGLDESIANSGTFPSLSLDVANADWIYSDLALSVGGTTYFASGDSGFEVTIDNMLDTDRFFNSLTRTAIARKDHRHTGVNLKLPAGDAWATYGTGSAGVAVTATWTNGGAILTMTMPKVVFPRKPVEVAKGSEILIPLSGGIAYRSGSTASLTITLSPGP